MKKITIKEKAGATPICVQFPNALLKDLMKIAKDDFQNPQEVIRQLVLAELKRREK